uniref:arsenate reductase ArsC n=1 Tax=Mycobacterium paragordonae TaxID=1389713 RepID=UPI0018CC06C5
APQRIFPPGCSDAPWASQTIVPSAYLHPRFQGQEPPGFPGRFTTPVRVLFVCTGNSSRSQIAEALLQQAAGRRARVASAGSRPKPIHANTFRVLREYGIDVTGRRSKHLDELRRRRFDYVITVCDKVREICPEFPGGQAIHWSIPDPATAGAGRAGYPAFRAVTADLHSRIRYFAQAITPNRKTLGGEAL